MCIICHIGTCWAAAWVSPVTWDVLDNCVGEPCHMGCAGQLCGWAVTWDLLGNCVGEPHHMGCAGETRGWAPSHGMCWAIMWVSPVTCTQYKCCRRSHKEQYNQCCFHITTFFYSTMSWWWSYWTPDPGKNVNFVRDNHMIMYAVWIQLSI